MISNFVSIPLDDETPDPPPVKTRPILDICIVAADPYKPRPEVVVYIQRSKPITVANPAGLQAARKHTPTTASVQRLARCIVALNSAARGRYSRTDVTRLLRAQEQIAVWKELYETSHAQAADLRTLAAAKQEWIDTLALRLNAKQDEIAQLTAQLAQERKRFKVLRRAHGRLLDDLDRMSNAIMESDHKLARLAAYVQQLRESLARSRFVASAALIDDPRKFDLDYWLNLTPPPPDLGDILTEATHGRSEV